MPTTLRCGRYILDLRRPKLMGIENVTTDSFSGDGRRGDLAGAIAQAQGMIEAGADLIDIGGESSRPGAEPVPLQQELDAVLPVLEALRECGVPLSVDTVKPEVMREALQAGADLVNDISALSAGGAMDVVAASPVAVCLMHMQGQPRSMQLDPHYGDVVAEVGDYLEERARAAEAAGIGRDRIMIDPGFGFGKTLAHNIALLRHADRIVARGWPVLAGMSRKSMLGGLTGRPVGEREFAGAAAIVLAAERGVRLFRVHDVAAARDALAVWAAVADS